MRLAQHPNTGLIHLHDRIDPFRGRKPSACVFLNRNRIAIHGDDLKSCPASHPVRQGRAGVQDVEEHALAFLDANGLARAKHSIVDRGIVV